MKTYGIVEKTAVAARRGNSAVERLEAAMGQPHLASFSLGSRLYGRRQITGAKFEHFERTPDLPPTARGGRKLGIFTTTMWAVFSVGKKTLKAKVGNIEDLEVDLAVDVLSSEEI